MKQTSGRWYPGKIGSVFVGLREETTCSLRLSTREHRTVTFNPKFIPSDEHIIEDVTLRNGGVIVVFRTGGLLSDDFRLMAVPMNFTNPRVYPRLEERAKKWVREHPESANQYGFDMVEQVMIAAIQGGIKDDFEQMKRHKEFMKGSFFKIEL